MKETIRRLILVHAAVVSIGSFLAGFLWGVSGGLAFLVGGLVFSVPVVAFSFQVLKASSGGPERFLGRFMLAEFLKWLSSAVLLALAFLSAAFLPIALISGFLFTVVVQLFFPIFVPKASES